MNTREQFEAAWRKEYPLHSSTAFTRSGFDPERYANTRVQDGWLMWQAARATPADHSKLQVWSGSMPESNGKTNFTAILHRGDIIEGFTIDRSEYPDRVRYEADRVRWLIGEIDKEPWILDYDADKHSGYATPADQDAYAGTREDLAIWKKRALEAEELNRKFMREINGPTFMGEPANHIGDAAEKVDADSAPVAWMRAYRQFSEHPIDPDPGYLVTSFHQNADHAAKFPAENVPLYAVPQSPQKVSDSVRDADA